MSRWRETICGTALKTGAQSADFSRLIPENSSEVLSCGGAFLLKGQVNSLKQRRSPTVLHLPKQEGEIVICSSEDQYTHYKASSHAFNDLFEGIEGSLTNLESKMWRQRKF